MAETWKRPVMIGVKSDLLERAQALNLDIPEITERALNEAISRASAPSEQLGDECGPVDPLSRLLQSRRATRQPW